MKKDILVNKDKTEVTLELTLTRRIMARDPVMTITTRMAQAMLENEQFKLDKCVIPDIIDNHNTNSKHDGRWTFSLARELVTVSSSNEESGKTYHKVSPKKKKKQ